MQAADSGGTSVQLATLDKEGASGEFFHLGDVLPWLKLASFLIEFLSEPGELIADPFGGSFTSAKAAELLGRRWISTEKVVDYVVSSAYRFQDCLGFYQRLAAK
jgi:site-specific DNA-methyltransferase (cytosine-N4-specific)